MNNRWRSICRNWGFDCKAVVNHRLTIEILTSKDIFFSFQIRTCKIYLQVREEFSVKGDLQNELL